VHDTHKFQPGLPGEPDALEPIRQVAGMVATQEWRRRLMMVIEATAPDEIRESWRQEALDLLGSLSL